MKSWGYSADTDYNNTDTFHWTMSGNVITATLNHGLTANYSYSSVDANGSQVAHNETDVLTTLVYTLYAENSTTFPAREDETYTIQIDSGIPTILNTANSDAFYYFGTLVAPPENDGGFTAAQLTGQRWMLPFYNVPNTAYDQSFLSADLLTFGSDGTGHGMLTNTLFGWSVGADGTLSIATQTGGIKLQYFQLASKGGGG